MQKSLLFQTNDSAPEQMKAVEQDITELNRKFLITLIEEAEMTIHPNQFKAWRKFAFNHYHGHIVPNVKAALKRTEI